jgi:hypothetical protein
VLPDVEDRDRVRRLREPRGGERLAREAPARRRVVGKVLRQQLDRDGAPKHGVLRAVDLAHPAAGDRRRVAIALGNVVRGHLRRAARVGGLGNGRRAGLEPLEGSVKKRVAARAMR